MKQLVNLNLTISTFPNISHQAIHEVLKSVGSLEALTNLTLNLSKYKSTNTSLSLPETTLKYLSLGKNIQNLVLDLSCNQRLSSKDMAVLISKIPVEHKLKSICINLDFCTKIEEEDI